MRPNVGRMVYLYRVQPTGGGRCEPMPRQDPQRPWRNGLYLSNKIYIPLGMVVEYESVYDRMDVCAFELEDESVDLGRPPHNREYGVYPMNLDAHGRRIDSADGMPYTREEFLEEYGGLTEWDRSFPHGKVQLAFHLLDMRAWGQEVFVDRSAVAKLKLLWSVTIYTFEADAYLWNFIGAHLRNVSEKESDVSFWNDDKTQGLRVHMDDAEIDESTTITRRQLVDLMKGTEGVAAGSTLDGMQGFLRRENGDVMDDDLRRRKNIVWKLFRNARMKVQISLFDADDRKSRMRKVRP